MATRGQDKSPVRVLYIHGMNSGPGSLKPSVLAQYFLSVHTPSMRLNQRAKAARVQLAFVWLLCCLAGLYLSRRASRLGRWGRALLSLGIGSACAAFAYLPVKHRTVATMLSKGVEQQRRAISRFQPQVVVASSFGGAIALEVIRKGIWRGPTVLLAPAHSLVARGMGAKGDLFLQRISSMRLDELPDYCKLHVVHGMEDTTVPVADSLELAASLSGDALPQVSIGENDLSNGSQTLLLTLAESEGHELEATTRSRLPDIVARMAS